MASGMNSTFLLRIFQDEFRPFHMILTLRTKLYISLVKLIATIGNKSHSFQSQWYKAVGPWGSTAGPLDTKLSQSIYNKQLHCFVLTILDEFRDDEQSGQFTRAIYFTLLHLTVWI